MGGILSRSVLLLCGVLEPEAIFELKHNFYPKSMTL